MFIARSIIGGKVFTSCPNVHKTFEEAADERSQWNDEIAVDEDSPHFHTLDIQVDELVECSEYEMDEPLYVCGSVHQYVSTVRNHPFSKIRSVPVRVVRWKQACST